MSTSKAKKMKSASTSSNGSTSSSSSTALAKAPASVKNPSLVKASANKPITKTAFVLKLPLELTAKEVVAKAKASGIAMTPALVYVIRSEARKRAARTAKGSNGKQHAAPSRKRRRVKANRRAPQPQSQPLHTNGQGPNGHTNGAQLHTKAEVLLKAVAAELGLSHAMNVLRAEQEAVHRLMNH